MQIAIGPSVVRRQDLCNVTEQGSNSALQC
jgi:hypothetical protein